MKKVKILGKSIPILVLVLLGVGMVSATVLTYFGVLTQTVTVEQAVILTGNNEETLTAAGGETVVSGEHTLESKTSVIVPVTLVTAVNPNETGITTKIVGELELTKKTVDFNSDKWDIPNDAAKVQINYTIVGTEFNAEVTSGAEEGYVLIYYKDKSDRFNDPAEAILVEGNSFPYLPYTEDRNSEEDGTYDYCVTNEYLTCHGAKIWYVPSDAILLGNVLDWGRVSEFYFESSLIQYNPSGDIIIYPSEVLDFKVHTTFSTANKGTYKVTTEAQV